MLKNLLFIIVGLALTVLGEYLAFWVYTNIEYDIVMGLLGILAFCSIFIGVIFLVSPYINLWIKVDKQLNTKQPIYRGAINTGAFLLLTIPFIAAGMVFYSLTSQYHDDQLKQYGVVTRIKIQSEITGSNSRHDMCFEFKHNGEKWEGMLGYWNYEVGDSADIIYSSENPNEVAWYELYLANNTSANK